MAGSVLSLLWGPSGMPLSRHMSEMGTRVHLALCGRLVGIDPRGNMYFEQRAPMAWMAARWGHKKWRSVLYHDTPDPGALDPCWMLWLHGLISVPPVHHAHGAQQTPGAAGDFVGGFCEKASCVPAGSVLKRERRIPPAPAYRAWLPSSLPTHQS